MSRQQGKLQLKGLYTFTTKEVFARCGLSVTHERCGLSVTHERSVDGGS